MSDVLIHWNVHSRPLSETICKHIARIGILNGVRMPSRCWRHSEHALQKKPSLSHRKHGSVIGDREASVVSAIGDLAARTHTRWPNNWHISCTPYKFKYWPIFKLFSLSELGKICNNTITEDEFCNNTFKSALSSSNADTLNMRCKKTAGYDSYFRQQLRQ